MLRFAFGLEPVEAFNQFGSVPAHTVIYGWVISKAATGRGMSQGDGGHKNSFNRTRLSVQRSIRHELTQQLRYAAAIKAASIIPLLARSNPVNDLGYGIQYILGQVDISIVPKPTLWNATIYSICNII